MSDKIVDDGGNAFPLPLGTANMSEPSQSGGMTLRDYFAAKAMQALIHGAPNGTGFGTSHEDTNETYAIVAYSLADAMLKARQK